jgi:hypothetical protein
MSTTIDKTQDPITLSTHVPWRKTPADQDREDDMWGDLEDDRRAEAVEPHVDDEGYEVTR